MNRYLKFFLLAITLVSILFIIYIFIVFTLDAENNIETVRLNNNLSEFLLETIIIEEKNQTNYINLQQEHSNPQTKFTNSDFPNEVFLINFFASWCVPCAVEHKYFIQLKENYNIAIYGIAWQDSKKNIIQWDKKKR